MTRYPRLSTAYARRLFDQFEKSTRDFPIVYTRMVEVVNASPTLCRMINEGAAPNGYLKSMGLLPAASTWSGVYDRIHQTIQLSFSENFDPERLKYLTPEAKDLRIIGIAIHELSHGVNRQMDAAGFEQIRALIAQLAKTRACDIDYSCAIQQYLAYKAKGEALSEMAAWNAAVEYLINKRGGASLEDMGQEYPRITPYVARDGQERALSFKPALDFLADATDLRVDARNPMHLRGFEQCYFFEGLLNVGHGGSNYPNTYATEVLRMVHEFHQVYAGPASKIMLDMRSLGLSEKQIEMNGMNVGGAGNQVVYYDIGSPDVARYFDDTVNPKNAKTKEVNRHLCQYNDNQNADVFSLPDAVMGEQLVYHMEDEKSSGASSTSSSSNKSVMTVIKDFFKFGFSGGKRR